MSNLGTPALRPITPANNTGQKQFLSAPSKLSLGMCALSDETMQDEE
jgi:hypothetical protein